MQKVTIYYSIQNGGDGSAYPIWFLTSEAAEEHQERIYEGWSEPCIGSIETFVGSSTYDEAKKYEEACRAEWADEDRKGTKCEICKDYFHEDEVQDGMCEQCEEELGDV